MTSIEVTSWRWPSWQPPRCQTCLATWMVQDSARKLQSAKGAGRTNNDRIHHIPKCQICTSQWNHGGIWIYTSWGPLFALLGLANIGGGCIGDANLIWAHNLKKMNMIMWAIHHSILFSKFWVACYEFEKIISSDCSWIMFLATRWLQ